MQVGKLYIVATPIGNLQDMTYRAIDTLNMVDVIIAEDTRTSGQLLKHFDIKTNCESYHKFNEVEKSPKIIEYLKQGKNIALISDAGTPGISDPGNIIVQECVKNNIEVVPIPGSCAFVQALISSGFNTINFSFFGFLPVEKKERKEVLKNILNATTNLAVIYEAPHKLLKTLQDILDTCGNVNVCISREITKMYEAHFRTNISDAINYYNANTPKGEFVIVIQLEHKQEEKEDISNILTQEKILNKYKILKDSLSLKDISKMLAEDFNLSKNDIYSFLLKHTKTE